MCYGQLYNQKYWYDDDDIEQICVIAAIKDEILEILWNSYLYIWLSSHFIQNQFVRIK